MSSEGKYLYLIMTDGFEVDWNRYLAADRPGCPISPDMTLLCACPHREKYFLSLCISSTSTH